MQGNLEETEEGTTYRAHADGTGRERIGEDGTAAVLGKRLASDTALPTSGATTRVAKHVRGVIMPDVGRCAPLTDPMVVGETDDDGEWHAPHPSISELERTGRPTTSELVGMQPAQTRSGRRITWPPAHFSGSTAATAAPPHRRRRKGLMPACNEKQCGLLVEIDGEEKRVCHACHRPPNKRWKHFAAENVDDAICLYEWDANNRRLCDSGGVKEDYRPSCKCVCDRGACVYAVVKALRSEGAKKTCAICLKSRQGPQVFRWLKAGPWVGNFTSHFRSARSSIATFRSSSTELRVDSDLCNRCYMEGYHHKDDIPIVEKKTVREFIRHLENETQT
ncbi:unnamed protein product [Ectocarpus sp. 4 AP-2014]